MSDRLIDIDTFIKQAKKRGVNFGKGNPYNRIRYYTKIGLLPHMIRKKEGEDNIKGHYPERVLEILDFIEEQKKAGLSNEEILKILDTKTKSRQFSTWLTSKEIRNQFLKYGTFIMLLFILLTELGAIEIGTVKSEIIPNEAIITNTETNNILESGSAFLPAGRNSIFVKAKKVTTTSKVYVTFRGDYSPAVRYWVSDVVTNAGFYINIDSPAYNDVEFDWWISP